MDGKGRGLNRTEIVSEREKRQHSFSASKFLGDLNARPIAKANELHDSRRRSIQSCTGVAVENGADITFPTW
jgi:hypothetical protein